jgi:hypothetical protein
MFVNVFKANADIMRAAGVISESDHQRIYKEVDRRIEEERTATEQVWQEIRHEYHALPWWKRFFKGGPRW